MSLVTGVDFTTLPTTDIDRAFAFYGETLGLPVHSDLRERGFAEFQAGNLTLSLMDPAAVGREFVPNANPIALQVPDVHETRRALEERGVPFFGDTIDTGVCHMAFLADTEGNALMLHHRYAPKGEVSTGS